MSLRDVLRRSPWDSRLTICDVVRWCTPLSLCTAGASPGESVPLADSRLESASSEVGRSPLDQATDLPSKQSIAGFR